MDLLRSAAISYNNLMKYSYEFKAGKKGNIAEFKLCFLPENFYHLIGLHYLKDFHDFKNAKTKSDKVVIFKNILSGKINYNTIEKSDHFSEVKDRVDWFHRIDGMIARLCYPKSILVKYINKNNNQGIPSGFMFYEDYNPTIDNYIYLFSVNSKNIDAYTPCSFVVSNNNAKLINQTKYTILEVKVTKKL